MEENASDATGPGFRSLRADPRYKALLRKMNLPD